MKKDFAAFVRFGTLFLLAVVLLWRVTSAATLPVAAYALDEGAGSTTLDFTGNNHTGTLSGGITWTAGRYSGAVSFDGLSGEIALSNASSINLGTSDFTVSTWIKRSSLGNSQRHILSKCASSGWTSGCKEFYFGPDNTLRFGSYSGGDTVGPAVADTNWHHVAVTFADSNNQIRLYIDGVNVTTGTNNLDADGSSHVLMIGNLHSSNTFAGLVDNLRIYASVLTSSEIQADMSTAVVGGPPADATAPSVSITSPAEGVQVNDIITVLADASDNIGIAGVQFFLDGTAFGAEDLDPPYGLSWDTRTVANGAHILTARARDTSGNTAVSQGVTVNVANINFFQNEVLAAGFDLPTSIEFLPDGRMLVVELAGTIKILPIPYTQADPTPFLQLTNIGSAGVQQGVYDICLDPDFQNNHFYYVFYTAGSPNRDRLSRFTANPTLTGTVVGSEVVLYQDTQNANAEHHGGAINFGNDGKIYFTTGEHFDPGLAQSLSSPRGKVHRINVDGTAPADNPFYDGSGPNWDSIWALGLRNPYRAYYDIPTGRLIFGDVGGNDYSTAIEEVNLGAAGANYGWPNSEGNCSLPCRSPLYSYPHSGRDAAVTGGFVYHGTHFPSTYQGSYFFADYTQNWIRRLTFDANGNVNGVFNFEPADGSVDGPYGDIVYLAEGPDGALYYVDLGYSDIGGSFGISKIRRIRYVETNQAPVAVSSANPNSGLSPLTVHFSSEGSRDPEDQPLSYLWTFGDNTTSTEANPAHTFTQSGQYTTRLTVSDGEHTTLAPPLVISVGNPPNATIVSPQDGSFFRAGDTIFFSGSGFDTEDGTLEPGAFTWNIDFLHAGHVHPGTPMAGVTSGSFTIPTEGHDFSGDTRYRVALKVTDSSGLTDTKSVTIWPMKASLTFDTVPSGLTLYLDGIAKTTPFIHDTLVGYSHLVDAPNQSTGFGTYVFTSWSDQGAQQHALIVPEASQAYTATYTLLPSTLPSNIAAYALNEGSGLTASDATGNNHTGMLSGGVSWTAGGKFDGAASFGGSTGAITLSNPSTINLGTSDFTVSAWIKRSTLSGSQRHILSKCASSSWTAGCKEFYFAPNNTLRFGSHSGGDTIGPSIADTNWHHVAVTFTDSNNQVQLYVDGVNVTTGTNNLDSDGASHALIVGNLHSTNPFAGLIDNLRIYDKALTLTELETDMNTPVGGTASPDTVPPSVAVTSPPNNSEILGSVTIVANATDNTAVAGVRFLIDGADFGTEDTSDPYSVIWNTATVSNGVHTIAALARDGAGNQTLSSVVTVTVNNPEPDTEAPSVPANLAASAVSTSQINLTWTAATDNIGVTGYNIYRCQGSGCTPVVQITTTGTNSYQNSALAPATTYVYAVDAFDAAGNTSALSAVASATTQAAPAASPIAAYNFDEGSGTTASDASGNNHTGTLSAGVSWTASGRFGSAVSFNGSTGAITLSNPSTINLGTSDFTMSAWIKRSTLSGSQRHILSKCSSSSWTAGCKEFYIAPNNTLRFGSYSGGDTIGPSIADTNWHHVAVTFTDSNNQLRLYVDGVNVATATHNLDADNANHVLMIGNLRSRYPFAGLIDNARIYNRVLSQAEIQTDMNTSGF